MGKKIRDPSGRILRGAKLPKSHREAISEGQIERYRRNREQVVVQPDKKHCTQCGKLKRVPEDFQMRKRALKSGEITRYPSGECKECNRVRSAAWRAKQRREKSPEELTAMYRRWNTNRDPQQRNQYQREYQAMQRRKAGIPVRGPWKKYRDEKREVVPREPFAEWISKNGGASRVARLINVDESFLRRIVNGEQYLRDRNGKLKKYKVKNVSVDLVDRCLIEAGQPEMLAVLYPSLFD